MPPKGAPAAGSTPRHPLLQAARDGELAALREAGSAVLEVVDEDGKTALHHAAAGGHVEALAVLLDAGCNPNARTKSGLSPLHLAISGKSLAAAQLLVARGADVRAADAQTRTALHAACVVGDVAAATWLCEQGLRVEDATRDGMAAIHFASLGGSRAVVEWCVVAQGASAETPGAARQRPLHQAAARGHADLVKWLVEVAQVDVNATDAVGASALHLAAAAATPNEEILLALLRAGADPTRQDKSGNTPLDVAQARKPIAGDTSASASASAVDVPALFRASLLTPTGIPTAPRLLSRTDRTLVCEWTYAEAAGAGGGESAAASSAGGGSSLLSPFSASTRLLLAPSSSSSSSSSSSASAAPPSSAIPPVDGYEVQYTARWSITGWQQAMPADGFGASGSASLFAEPSATVSGLSADTIYTLRVRAHNRNGFGAWSERSAEFSTLTTGGTGSAAAASSSSTDAAADSSSSASSSAASAASATASTGSSSSSSTPSATTTAMAAAAAAPESYVSPYPLLAPEVLQAARQGELSVLRGLDRSGTSIAGADEEGRSVLHLAAQNGHTDLVEWLATQDGRGAIRLEGRERVGATPLLLAVVAGHLATAQALARRGASLDTSDNRGYSALHYAALKGHPAVFRWLLEAGADPTARTLRGQSVESALKHPALRALLFNASTVPVSPPTPSVVETTRFAVLIEIAATRLAPGCPLPLEFEVQYSPKFNLLAATESHVIPSGIDPHELHPSLLPHAPTGSSSSSPATTSADASAVGAPGGGLPSLGSFSFGSASHLVLAPTATSSPLSSTTASTLHSPAGPSASPSTSGSSSSSGSSSGSSHSPSMVGLPAPPSPIPISFADAGGSSGGSASSASSSASSSSSSSLPPATSRSVALRHLVDLLQPNTTYTFRVRARNRIGWSPWCAKTLEASTRKDSDRFEIPSYLLVVPASTSSSSSSTSSSSSFSSTSSLPPSSSPSSASSSSSSLTTSLPLDTGVLASHPSLESGATGPSSASASSELRFGRQPRGVPLPAGLIDSTRALRLRRGLLRGAAGLHTTSSSSPSSPSPSSSSSSFSSPGSSSSATASPSSSSSLPSSSVASTGWVWSPVPAEDVADKGVLLSLALHLAVVGRVESLAWLVGLQPGDWRPVLRSSARAACPVAARHLLDLEAQLYGVARATAVEAEEAPTSDGDESRGRTIVSNTLAAHAVAASAEADGGGGDEEDADVSLSTLLPFLPTGADTVLRSSTSSFSTSTSTSTSTSSSSSSRDLLAWDESAAEAEEGVRALAASWPALLRAVEAARQSGEDGVVVARRWCQRAARIARAQRALSLLDAFAQFRDPHRRSLLFIAASTPTSIALGEWGGQVNVEAAARLATLVLLAALNTVVSVSPAAASMPSASMPSHESLVEELCDAFTLALEGGSTDVARVRPIVHEWATAEDAEGTRALHWAAWAGQVLPLRLAARVETAVTLETTDPRGWTTTHYAASSDEGVRVLRDWTEEVVLASGSERAEALRRAGRAADARGVTPLHLAAAANSVASLRALVALVGEDARAVLGVQDALGRRALHSAVSHRAPATAAMLAALALALALEEVGSGERSAPGGDDDETAGGRGEAEARTVAPSLSVWQERDGSGVSPGLLVLESGESSLLRLVELCLAPPAVPSRPQLVRRSGHVVRLRFVLPAPDALEEVRDCVGAAEDSADGGARLSAAWSSLAALDPAEPTAAYLRRVVDRLAGAVTGVEVQVVHGAASATPGVLPNAPSLSRIESVGLVRTGTGSWVAEGTRGTYTSTLECAVVSFDPSTRTLTVELHLDAAAAASATSDAPTWDGAAAVRVRVRAGNERGWSAFSVFSDDVLA